MIGECEPTEEFDLYLERSNDHIPKYKGANGVRGTLYLPSNSGTYHTAERLDGYKMLPVGDYHCEFAFWTVLKDGIPIRVKAIRVLGDYSKDRIYFHIANWVFQLTGCVAVGLKSSTHGVSYSAAALADIFDALGGWVEGKRLRLRVVEKHG